MHVVVVVTIVAVVAVACGQASTTGQVGFFSLRFLFRSGGQLHEVRLVITVGTRANLLETDVNVRVGVVLWGDGGGGDGGGGDGGGGGGGWVN